MNTKAFLVEVFAVVASYLMITMTVSSAATLRTYDNGGIEIGTPMSFDPSWLVDGAVSVNQAAETVNFSVSNGSSLSSIEGVWLYNCKDKYPNECMSSIFYVPDSFTGNAEATYSWNDVSVDGRAGLLYFVKVRYRDMPVWMGFWVEVEKSGQSFVVSQSDISEIGVYASDIGMVSTIREFIKKYQMIPANPGWISRIVFDGASLLHEISIQDESSFVSPARPDSATVHGSDVESVPGSYNFVLPVESGTKTPITLFSNPSYTCGMFGCESDSGESSSSCCLDCGCGYGYYCDAWAGCRLESGMSLGIYGSVSPRVLNCYESHVTQIPVEIMNPPSSYSVSESWYKLGGSFSPTTCTGGSGDVYVCPVTVPPVAECGSGEFRVTDNAIRLKIEYMDGSVSTSKYLETPFPDVTVGSFVCGEFGCESDLGESSSSCCLDCGCPSGYCDYSETTDTYECREDPSVADISATMEPLHFYTHTPGSTVYVDITIGNSPGTMSLLEPVSCSMGCRYDEAGECESSCDIECVEAGEGEDHDLSCALSFTIAGYTELSDYSLSPELTLDIGYENGTEEYVEKELNKPLSKISVGAHWCGDRACGEDEGSGCCYDCGCGEGQYCDTQSIMGPTESDGCRVASFGVMVDSMGSLDLVDSSVEHRVPVFMHVNYYPTGTEVSVNCGLAGGNVPCEVYCERAASGEESAYNISCEMLVPVIDYLISPYFDSADREIRLPSNSLNVTLQYNDGYQKAEMYHGEDLGEVVIEVTSNCGLGGCEYWLGEHPGNCCRDCGCSGFGENYFCYQGASPDGECIDNSTINLAISGLDPDPPRCVIGRVDGDCNFIKTHIINAHVIDSPPDLEVLDAYYTIDGGDQAQMDCIKAASYGRWDCPIAPPKIEVDWSSDVVEGTLDQDIEIHLSVSYSLNGTLVMDDLSASAAFGVNKTKSDALISCENELLRLQKQITKVRTNQQEDNSWGVWFQAAGAAAIAFGIYLIYKGMATSPWGWSLIAWGSLLVALGIMMMVMGNMGKSAGVSLDTQISELEAMLEQKRKICSSEEFEVLADATYGINPLSAISGYLTS